MEETNAVSHNVETLTIKRKDGSTHLYILRNNIVDALTHVLMLEDADWMRQELTSVVGQLIELRKHGE